LGTISPKGYRDISVSATFSDATNARIHFDTYGSKVDPPPPGGPGQIVRNSLSSDCTVKSTAAPPPTAYPPTACFTEDPETPNVGQMVTFDASASQPGYDGDDTTLITQYSWDFNEDGIIDLATPNPTATYTYSAPGTYTVTLIVLAPSIGNVDPSYIDTDIYSHDKTVHASPVGGVWTPANVVELLAPWIVVALISLGVAAAGTKRFLTKRSQNNNLPKHSSSYYFSTQACT
jgi:hypothetical protein